ncbi:MULTISPECIES: DUF5977 domain-containing protein [Sphingobacterium]|uniref:DUF5977 domain-containing protein n=1 Tax=Sphingobacterium TaxID=28453 RepID=UPI00257E4595|nr:MULTISPECIES: DUF5977 domain-containing protein [Sphingobacterium]
MMKTLFSTLCFSIATVFSAQTSTDAVFDAPIDNNPFRSTNVNLGSVNTYTGRADTSIPLYTINFGGIEIPIRLQYNAEGVQVDQYASEVGLGWTLSSVGEIYKEVNGNYEDNEGRDNWKAYLRMHEPPQPFPTDFPDYYTINTPNLSGKFFIDREFKVREIEGYNTANITFLRSQPLEEEALKYGVVSNRKRIQDCPMPPAGPFVYYHLFTMTGNCNSYTPGNDFDTQQVKINKDKFTYTFSEIERIAISTNTKDVNFRGSALGSSTTNMSFNTGLKLSEIKDNTTKNVLQVTYKPLARINENVKYDKVWDKLIRRVDNGSVTNYLRAIKEFDVTTKETYIKKLPSKIKTNDAEIIFNYENLREDKITRNMILSEIPLAPDVEYIGEIWGQSIVNPFVKEPLLKSMLIKNNLGQIVMQYNFVYSYFDSGCGNADVCKRLKLTAVEKGYGENNLNKEIYKLDYYEDINLPKITSLNKDVFGFKNDIIESSIKDSYGFPVRPYVYQYTETRNNINFSYFSPLKVPSLNPVMTSGQFEQGISGLENIRAWSLKSITYPTQSVQSFIYEPHEFNWKGSKIKGGGLRIKEINLIDPFINKTLTTKYTYGDGLVSSLPMVAGDEDIALGGVPVGVKSSVSRSYSTLVTKSKGSYVIYPTSRKIDPDGGYSDYKFSSYSDYPEIQSYKWQISGNNVDMDMDSYLFSKTSLASKMFNYDYLRGNIVNTKLYDKLGNIVKEIANTYSTTEYVGPNLVEPGVYPRTRILFYPTASTLDANFMGATAQYTHSLIKRNNISNIIEKNYLSGGLVQSSKSLTYTDRFNLLKNITSSGPVNNDTQINNYAFESTDQLINTNVDYEQIKIGHDKKNGSDEVEKTKTTYSTTNGLVLPNAIYTYDYAMNDWDKILSFDKYDSKGNILQITGANGPSVMVWGYNQSKVIAKIVGATYGEVMNAFGLDPQSNSSYLQLEIVKKSNLDVDENTENQYLSELSTFRNSPNLKNFQVITDVYDPLVGLKVRTDVSGLSSKNIYDNSNRISKVLDNEGKTLSEYKYKYASARFFNAEQSKSFAKTCGSSAFGSTIKYTVPENTYSSTFSQADADNQATNDINANGQNFANNNGTCTPFSCSITQGPSINWHYGTIGIYPGSGLNFRIKMEYVFNSGMSWQSGNGVLVGKIVGNCLSPNVRTSSAYSTGVWGITVQPNGEIYVKFVPGATFVLPPNNTVINLDFALSIN